MARNKKRMVFETSYGSAAPNDEWYEKPVNAAGQQIGGEAVLGPENSNAARARDENIMSKRAALVGPLEPREEFQPQIPDFSAAPVEEELVAPEVIPLNSGISTPQRLAERVHRDVAMKPVAGAALKEHRVRNAGIGTPYATTDRGWILRGIRPQSESDIDEARSSYFDRKRELDRGGILTPHPAVAALEEAREARKARAAGILSDAQRKAYNSDERVAKRAANEAAWRKTAGGIQAGIAAGIARRRAISGPQDANPRMNAGIRLQNAQLAAQERMARAQADASARGEEAKAAAAAYDAQTKRDVAQITSAGNVAAAREKAASDERVANINANAKLMEVQAGLAQAQSARELDWAKLQQDHDINWARIGIDQAKLVSADEATRLEEQNKAYQQLMVLGPSGAGWARANGQFNVGGAVMGADGGWYRVQKDASGAITGVDKLDEKESEKLNLRSQGLTAALRGLQARGYDRNDIGRRIEDVINGDAMFYKLPNGEVVIGGLNGEFSKDTKAVIKKYGGGQPTPIHQNTDQLYDDILRYFGRTM